MAQVADIPSPGTHAHEAVRSTARPAAHLTRGKLLEARPGLVVFQPRGTNYELHLEVANEFVPALNRPTVGVVRVRARKLYTVPSGGNFIAPILGSPRTVQGRVISVSPAQLVLQAGMPVVVDLPIEPHAIDLGSGPIEEGAIVNVVALPGAAYEPAAE